MTHPVISPARRRRHRRDPERGQVVVLFALAAFVVVGMVAVSVDGGFGMVQMRRAQNAADFAAVAGTSAIKNVCSGTGQPPSNAAVYSVVQDVINQNSSSVTSAWTGTYLDKTGAVITGAGGAPYHVTNTGDYPPANACGVSVNVNPTWTPYLAQVVGVHSLSSTASAKSLLSPSTGSGSVGIVALNQIMPHEVLGGGTGSFNVSGTIFANSSVPYGPWNEAKDGATYDDVVDAKDNSNLILHGDMDTVGNNWPLDWCFGTASGTTPPYNNMPPGYPPTPDPYNSALCNNGSGSVSVVLQYDYIRNKQASVTDPLLPIAGTPGVPDPWVDTTQGLCPGETGPTARTVPAAVNGTTLLLPGEYASPVIITGGNVQFADCSGQYDPSGGATAYPGTFRFDGGLALLTPAGTTVQGANVVIATGSPVPLPGNVPGSWSGSTFVASGSGNGAPCYPAGVTTSSGTAEIDSGSPTCGGTTSTAPAPFGSIFASGPFKGVVSYNQSSFAKDSSQYGKGTNFSLILGGAGTISLTPPVTGTYRDIGLFQRRSVPGNFGLDAYPGDKAAITVNGVVYNASLQCNGMPVVNGACSTLSTLPQPNPFAYWDVGIVFSAGGMLQAGVGTGTGYPKTSAGTVQINGPCVVEDFNTDGGTSITIDGTQNTYPLPGVMGSGNPPIVG